MDWPRLERKTLWFRRKDDVLRFGPAKCERPGARCLVCRAGDDPDVEVSAQRRQRKVLECVRWAVRENRPLSNTPCGRKRTPRVWSRRSCRGQEEAGRLRCLERQGKKGCQEEEVVGSVGPHPQAMWDVELKVSTRFSNKKVRGGRGGQPWGTAVPEPD